MSVTVGDKVEFAGAGPWSEFVAAVVEVVDGGYIIGIDGSGLRRQVTEQEITPVARKTVVTHPDGTQSTRSSANNIYIYAVEMREDMWAYAKLQHAQAAQAREAKAKFIEAVRGGVVVLESRPMPRDPDRHAVYVQHADGERWWLGSGNAVDPVDRKTAVRSTLADFDRLAARHEAEARKAESGPQFRYGAVRWSMSSETALKGLREFQNQCANIPGRTFRMVPAEAAE